jgi:hypothetical protein
MERVYLTRSTCELELHGVAAKDRDADLDPTSTSSIETSARGGNGVGITAPKLDQTLGGRPPPFLGSFHEAREHIQPVALRRSFLRAPQRLDLLDRSAVIRDCFDRRNIHATAISHPNEKGRSVRPPILVTPAQAAV